ncbi:hypothetical protein ACXR0O_15215 [Verrucomicrobiota bacterium sgz303538]
MRTFLVSSRRRRSWQLFGGQTERQRDCRHADPDERRHHCTRQQPWHSYLRRSDTEWGGTLALEINGRTVGTQYDQINVTGMVSLTANTAFTLSLGFIPAVGDTFTIINNDDIDAINRGTFALSFGGTPLTEGALFSTANGVQFRITYAGGIDNNDVVLTTTIPEPASVASLIGALGCSWACSASAAGSRADELAV